MPDPVPLTPDQYVTMLRDGISAWVASHAGVIDTSGDPHELIEHLADAPRAFRVVIHWGGEKAQGDQAEFSGMTTQTIEVFIVKQKGMKLDPGAHLIEVDPGDPAFLALIGMLRDQVRAFIWPVNVTYQYVLYRAGEWVQPEKDADVVIFRMTFEIIATLPYVNLP